MSYVVLGASVSPFVRKVRVVLAEKGLDYQHQQVNPFAPPEGWREISPLGKIPALRDGERVINDSAVICQYLERRFPRPPLYPADDYELARALWLEQYVGGGLIAGAGPKVFMPLVLRPLLSSKAADEAAEATAREFVEKEMPVFLDYLEGQLGEREFFVGERLSIADLAIASAFVNLRHAGYAPERRRWPRLRAFLDRLWSRPGFNKAIEEETPVFGKRAARISD